MSIRDKIEDVMSNPTVMIVYKLCLMGASVAILYYLGWKGIVGIMIGSAVVNYLFLTDNYYLFTLKSIVKKFDKNGKGNEENEEVEVYY